MQISLPSPQHVMHIMFCFGRFLLVEFFVLGWFPSHGQRVSCTTLSFVLVRIV